MLAVIISMTNVGLMLVTLALFTCIIADNIHYLQRVKRTVAWYDVEIQSPYVTILISVILLVYNFYTSIPTVPVSWDMFTTIIAQLLYLTVGILLYRHTARMVAYATDRIRQIMPQLPLRTAASRHKQMAHS